MSASEVYAGLVPAEVWRHFGALNDIPRPSGEEAAACDYVKQVAAGAGAASEQDSYGNVIVRIPATPGRESAPVTAVQAHLDMVCQKLPGVEHDFSRDPIRPQFDGDIVRASGTTLGADNGIGAALALALLTSPAFEHGSLELLFTVEEETGLTGAAGLDVSALQARYLINLDSEDPDELTVGCAGGAGVNIHLAAGREVMPASWLPCEITVSGLKGGHSGVQIHERLANAIQLLGETLTEVWTGGIDFRVVSLQGGSAHNAIPRDAEALLLVDDADADEVLEIVEETSHRLRQEWAGDEDGLRIEAAITQGDTGPALDANSNDAIILMLTALPHGVMAMSETFKGKVETSCNLAVISTAEETIDLHVSSRSFIESELQKQQIFVMNTANGLGGRLRSARRLSWLGTQSQFAAAGES